MFTLTEEENNKSQEGADRFLSPSWLSSRTASSSLLPQLFFIFSEAKNHHSFIFISSIEITERQLQLLRCRFQGFAAGGIL